MFALYKCHVLRPESIFSFRGDYADYRLVTFYFLTSMTDKNVLCIHYVCSEKASCFFSRIMYVRADIVHNREQIGARVRVRVKMHLSFKVILYQARELYFSEIKSLCMVFVSASCTPVTFVCKEFMKMYLRLLHIIFAFL